MLLRFLLWFLVCVSALLKALPLHCAQSTTQSEEPAGCVVSKGTLVVCKVSLVGQWVEVRARFRGFILMTVVCLSSLRNKAATVRRRCRFTDASRCEALVRSNRRSSSGKIFPVASQSKLCPKRTRRWTSLPASCATYGYFVIVRSTSVFSAPSWSD